MSGLLYSVDFCRYKLRENDALFVEGWVFSDTGAIETLQVFSGEGEKIPSTVVWKARPDLAGARPDIQAPECPGFTLKIPDVQQWLERVETLELVAGSQGGQETIASVSGDEVARTVAEDTILYQLDVIRYLDTSLELYGWFIDQAGYGQIQLLDGADRPLECSVDRFPKADVMEQYPDYVGPEDEVGYAITLPTVTVAGDLVKVVFQSRCSRKVQELDMKALKKEKELRQKQEYTPYTRQMKRNQPGFWELRRQRKQQFAFHPKISIVIPLYNTPLHYLRELLESIRKQSYENWELCLADGSDADAVENFIRRDYATDGRIHYKRLRNNLGISVNTNEALDMATGDYVMLADHDDVVELDALYEIARAINGDPCPELLYTDEDKITMDGNYYFAPYEKPDYDERLLEENNYICHIFVARRALLEEIGGFRREFDGAQDHDLILRCCEQVPREKICHIRKVLYHWRSHPDSTASNPRSKRYAYEAGVRAVREHFQRMGVHAEVTLTENPGFYKVQRTEGDAPGI